MSTDSPRVVGFCCNYTVAASSGAFKEAGLLPENVHIKRLPCTGRLEVSAVLDAFTEGADAVFVAGCPLDGCHNLTGSKQAGKRVGHVKVILKELDMDPRRVEMFFVPRGEAGPVVDAAREMARRAG
ncbi:MAG: hydrogenase iron-sulfur subunit [Desulfobacteraceae bacterium]|nr:hydrogenase iron-sulfur subunit [Desulfobacteraceae bacterium]